MEVGSSNGIGDGLLRRGRGLWLSHVVTSAHEMVSQAVARRENLVLGDLVLAFAEGATKITRMVRRKGKASWDQFQDVVLVEVAIIVL